MSTPVHDRISSNAPQRDTLLANFGLVAGVEQAEVALKRTLLDD